MTWSITDVIPPWGDSGERWSDNFEYQGQDQVNEKHLNYFIDSVGTLEDDVRSSLQDIDSDQDGTVDDSDRYDGLAPSDGSNGQILESDGTTVQWINNTATSASEDGTTVLTKPEDFNFINGMNVTDDGDNTVSVDADEAARAHNFVMY